MNTEVFAITIDDLKKAKEKIQLFAIIQQPTMLSY